MASDRVNLFYHAEKDVNMHDSVHASFNRNLHRPFSNKQERNTYAFSKH